MQTLTFNNKQLLFVPVPMTTESFMIDSIGGISALNYRFGSLMTKYPNSNSVWLPKGNYNLLGTIQKENGKVSTTIPDEVLEGLFSKKQELPLVKFAVSMHLQNLTLYDGEKYVVLEVNP